MLTSLQNLVLACTCISCVHSKMFKKQYLVTHMYAANRGYLHTI